MTLPHNSKLVWVRPVSPTTHSSNYPAAVPSEMSELDSCSESDQYSDLPKLSEQDSDDSEDDQYLDVPELIHQYDSDSDEDNDDMCNPYSGTHTATNTSDSEEGSIKAVLKYKKVCDKIRPVDQLIPEHLKPRRTFPEDPLLNLPFLPMKPPEFVPSLKVTAERMDALAIDQNEELSSEERKLLKHVLLLNERSIAFSEEERGTFRRDYFSDYIIPVIDHKPWTDKNIPIPLSHKDEIIKVLKDKIKAGVYESTQTVYRSKWFPVKKKEGGLRLVHDLQKLNGVTIRDAAVPPILEEFVEEYAGRSIYTVLDMFGGFHARVLDPRCRDLTAFQTPLGPFRLTSLPMGYSNAPGEFQACMQFILQDEIPDIAGVFIDDIPIKGPSTHYLDSEGKEETLPENPGIRRYIWEHLNDVHRILHRIGEAGGTVSSKKMQLCRSEVRIVGHSCSSKGREPVDDRALKILTWPTPVNTKEVRGFLGLCGTVRIWIKDYSQIAAPLNELTRKKSGFYWKQEQEDAFNHLKQLVSSAPALQPIDYKCGRPIILSVDTSIYGVGIILSQEDELGRRAAARYGSLPLKIKGTDYGQSKLELYGLMKALTRFRAYISGLKNLIVEVDASSIEGMLDNPDLQPSAIVNRWISNIKGYDFELRHVPAQKHQGPDALSRRRFTSDDETSCEDSEDEPEDDLVPIPQNSLPSSLLTPSSGSTFEEASTPSTKVKAVCVASAPHTVTDEDLEDILRYLVTGDMPGVKSAREHAQFKRKADPFYLQEAHMYRHQPGHPPQVVIFRKDRRKEILHEMHEESGHHGVWAVGQQVSLRYYWPGMKAQIKHHVRSCHTCQLRSTKKMHIPITVSHPPSLFSKVYLDVMSMPLAQGKRWLIGCRDDLSGVTECKAIARDQAKVIARFFLKRILLRYGIVQEVVTDNGPSFCKEFAELLKRYGIHHIKISAYNSQANGVVERGHFNIREALVKLCDGNLSQWPLMVPAVTFADRITVRRATGFSPYYLLHGVHPLMPGDLADATFLVTDFQPGMTSAELIEARTRQLLRLPEDLAKARLILKKSRFRSKEAYENKFARRIRLESYKPNDLVLIRNNPIENSVSIERKTANRYMGPYRVVRQTQGGSYILEEMDGSLLRHHVAAYRLIPYVLRQDLDSWADELGIEPDQGLSPEPSEDGDQDSLQATSSNNSSP